MGFDMKLPPLDWELDKNVLLQGWEGCHHWVDADSRRTIHDEKTCLQSWHLANSQRLGAHRGPFPFDQIFLFEIPRIPCDEWNSIFRLVGLTRLRSLGSKVRAETRSQTKGLFSLFLPFFTCLGVTRHCKVEMINDVLDEDYNITDPEVSDGHDKIFLARCLHTTKWHIKTLWNSYEIIHIWTAVVDESEEWSSQ